MNYWNC